MKVGVAKGFTFGNWVGGTLLCWLFLATHHPAPALVFASIALLSLAAWVGLAHKDETPGGGA